MSAPLVDETPRPTGIASNQPRDKTLVTVVLCGLPRSGTTWLGKILDSHPDTLYRHEPGAARTLDVPLVMDPVPTAEQARIIAAFVEGIPRLLTSHTCGPLPLFRKSYFSPLAQQFFRLSMVAGKAWSRAFGRVRLFAPLDWSRMGFSHLIWKSVDCSARLGAIARALGNRRVAHLVRHPCGNVASLARGAALGKMKKHGERDTELQRLASMAEAQARGLSLEYLKSRSLAERLAWLWVLSNERAMTGIEGLEGCCTIRYEDFCDAPLARARQLLEFAGLSWTSQTEDFIRASVAEDAKAYYSVFKNPKRSAEKWREELRKEDIDAIFAVVKGTPPGALYGL